MNTLSNEISIAQVAATGIRFKGNTLYVALSDGREVSLLLDQIAWLSWLAEASPAQREDWSLEPGGYAVYWEALDDGVEINHILAMESLN